MVAAEVRIGAKCSAHRLAGGWQLGKPLEGELAISDQLRTTCHCGRVPGQATAITGHVDLLIAATAHVHSARLYTRNADDLVRLEHLVEIGSCTGQAPPIVRTAWRAHV